MFFQKYLLFSAIERTSANKTRHFIHQFHEERYETKKNIHGLFMLLMTSDEEMKTTSEEITIHDVCARMSNLLLLLSSSSTSIRTILITNFYLIVHHSNININCMWLFVIDVRLFGHRERVLAYLSINYGHHFLNV